MSLDPCPGCGVAAFASHKNNCRKAARDFLEELAHYGRATADDDPRCPHCGVAEGDWTQYVTDRHRPVFDGDSISLTCWSCERDYVVVLSIRYSFRAEGPT